jgi:hypothetical protein
MKSHQNDDFNFLQNNLIVEEPSGFILENAP